MIATERYADERIQLLTRQFREAHLLSAGGEAGFTAAMSSADRRSSSALAEAIIALLVLSISAFTTRYAAGIEVVAWMALMLATFIGPLLVFVRPLYAVRERALLEYGRLASQHHLAFHERWVRGHRTGAELLGSADLGSVSDLNDTVGTVREIRFVPIDLTTVLQVLLASGIPMLAVVMSKVPLAELLGWIFSAVC